ncbi:hypothetical protein [Enterovibrio coralii]|nr:hypothetical protein [Enterovibrio coralii]
MADGLRKIQALRLQLMRSQYLHLKSPRAKELLARKAARLKKAMTA